MSDVVIRAEGLGKKYIIGHESGRESYVALRDVIARNMRNVWRKTKDMAGGRAIVSGDVTEEFWALKDVSFDIKKGETVDQREHVAPEHHRARGAPDPEAAPVGVGGDEIGLEALAERRALDRVPRDQALRQRHERIELPARIDAEHAPLGIDDPQRPGALRGLG